MRQWVESANLQVECLRVAVRSAVARRSRLTEVVVDVLIGAALRVRRCKGSTTLPRRLPGQREASDQSVHDTVRAPEKLFAFPERKSVDAAEDKDLCTIGIVAAIADVLLRIDSECRIAAEVSRFRPRVVRVVRETL